MKNSMLRTALQSAFAALVLGSAFLSLEASAAPASHPGFGRSRDAVSVHSGSGKETRSERKGLRARAALSMRPSGKRVRVCKENYTEFTCTTHTIY